MKTILFILATAAAAVGLSSCASFEVVTQYGSVASDGKSAKVSTAYGSASVGGLRK